MITKFECISDGKPDLLSLLKCVMAGAPGGKACGYELKDGVLKVKWSIKDKNTVPYLTNLTPELLAPQVQAWLDSTEPSEEKGDGDGSFGKGFHIWTELGAWEYNIFLIKPIWYYYGK
jgi:hypothetical protein